MDGQYAERRDSCHRAAATLGANTLREYLDAAASVDQAVATASAALSDEVSIRRVRHVLTELARTREAFAAMRAADWTTFGVLMDASHVSLRDDYEVTVPELDVAVEAARTAGAIGARMTGGGFGGSAIALVPAGTTAEVADAVAQAFAAQGFAAPTFLVSRAAAPAGVLA